MRNLTFVVLLAAASLAAAWLVHSMAVSAARTAQHCAVGVRGTQVSLELYGPQANATCRKFLAVRSDDGAHVYVPRLPLGPVICHDAAPGVDALVREAAGETGDGYRLCSGLSEALSAPVEQFT